MDLIQIGSKPQKLEETSYEKMPIPYAKNIQAIFAIL